MRGRLFLRFHLAEGEKSGVISRAEMSVVVFQRVGYYVIHATHKKAMWIVRGLHKWGIPCHSLKSVLNPGAGCNYFSYYKQKSNCTNDLWRGIYQPPRSKECKTIAEFIVSNLCKHGLRGLI